MKTQQSKWLGFALTGVVLSGVALFSTGCVVHEAGVGHAGGGYYDYYYYPETDVYFYPAGGIYYWRVGERWESGRRLPTTVVIRESARRSVRTHTQRPWEEHQEQHEERQEQHEEHHEHQEHRSAD